MSEQKFKVRQSLSGEKWVVENEHRLNVALFREREDADAFAELKNQQAKATQAK